MEQSPKAEAHGSPLVSVVVLAYNHLECTRECIESVFRYTQGIDYELIAVDNGSSDGTGEYLDSLGNVKKVAFPENIGVCTALNRGFAAARGEFIMYLSNDTVVTHRWLDNLLACLEDPKVGMVVPVCDASCNYQQVVLPHGTMEELQEAAERYNVSNPAFWEERLKLLTYAALYRTEILRKIGGLDEDFNPGSYDDDAVSFSIRRMGYKILLAKDTFIHHVGNLTFRKEYEKDGGLMRRNMNLFIRKFGADPYVAGLIDDNVLNLLSFGGAEDVNILGIGRSYGTTVLQLKNLCKRFGSKKIGLYYLCEQPLTMTDLKTICDECLVGRASDAASLFGGRRYDYIVVESDSRSLGKPEEFFPSVYGLLKPGGRLVCTAADPAALYSVMGVLYGLGAGFDGHSKYYYLCFHKN